MHGLTILFGLLTAACAREFQIQNKLGSSIWVGILGNKGHPPLNNGGFVLRPNEIKYIHSPDDWSGRFWARTWCPGNGKPCGTGDCGGGRIECSGAGGKPPTTVAEIFLDAKQGQDFYDISLVDGFNVVASITPLRGTGNCRTAGCYRDLNSNCPGDLRVKGPGGNTIACNSACNRYHTDEYCCNGKYNSSKTCITNNWRSNSAKYFKSNCPDAYSYAYDDPSSTFTCRAPAYRVTFG